MTFLFVIQVILACLCFVLAVGLFRDIFKYPPDPESDLIDWFEFVVFIFLDLLAITLGASAFMTYGAL